MARVGREGYVTLYQTQFATIGQGNPPAAYQYLNQPGFLGIKNDARELLWLSRLPVSNSAVPLKGKVVFGLSLANIIDLERHGDINGIVGLAVKMDIATSRFEFSHEDTARADRTKFMSNLVGSIWEAKRRVKTVESQSTRLLKLPDELRNAIYDAVADQIDHLRYMPATGTCVAMPCVTYGSGRELQKFHPFSEVCREVLHEFRAYVWKHRKATTPLYFRVINHNFRDILGHLVYGVSVPHRKITIALPLTPTWSEDWSSMWEWLDFLGSGGASHGQASLAFETLKHNVLYRVERGWKLCHVHGDHCQDFEATLL